MTYPLQLLSKKCSLTFSYTLLCSCNSFSFVIMAEGSENNWLSQGAGFGHLSSKSWTCKTSARFHVKIKPYWLGHLEMYCKLFVSSELWENDNCVYNIMSQSSVPSTWCTLYAIVYSHIELAGETLLKPLHRGPILGLSKLKVDSWMPNPLGAMHPTCHVLRRAI